MSRKVVFISIALAGLLGGFQNCAPMKSANPATEAFKASNEIAEILLKDAEAECDWLNSIKGSMSTQPDGATYTGAVNMQSFATHVSLIENAIGNVYLMGASSTAHVSEVKDSQGNLVLCGMSLTKVENFTGNIIVVSGNVVDLINVTGNVLVLDGIVGNVTGGNGLVAYRSGDGKVNVQIMGMPQAN